MKRITLSVMMTMLAFAITGCSSAKTSTSKSYTYNVSVGDETEKIKITVDTTGSLSLKDEEGNFVISTPNATEAVTGTFGSAEDYDEYYQTVNDSSDYTLLDEGDTDESNDEGVQYFIYTCYGKAGWETDCIARIVGSDTSVIMGSLLDSKEAQEIYKKISISKVE